MALSNPHAIIEIDGSTTFDSWQDPSLFKRVSIELTTNETSEATWEMNDPDFKFLDNFTRADGVALLNVRVWLGFGLELGEPVFKGLLARVEASTLVFYDMGFKMKLEKRPGYHNKRDDVAIIRKLAERNGLKFEGPDKPLNLEPHDAMAQDEQTDWEHALERAQDAGLVLYVRGDTLFAKPPAKVGEPKVTLAYRKDFKILRDPSLTYKVPENQEGRPRRVEIRGRAKGGRRLSGHSDSNQRGHSPVSIKHDLPRHSQKAATRRAQAQKELQREHAFQCSVKSLPHLPSIRADVRDTIRLENVGKLFSGLYICNMITHDFSARGFSTEYDLYRDIKAG